MSASGWAAQASRVSSGELRRVLARLPHQAAVQRAAILTELRARGQR